MAHNDSHAAATKQDIHILTDEIGKLYDKNEQWKQELETTIIESEGRTKLHFDVVAENLHRDFLGAHKDRIENHEDRIRRLERRAGIAGAKS